MSIVQLLNTGLGVAAVLPKKLSNYVRLRPNTFVWVFSTQVHFTGEELGVFHIILLQ
jgi:hypothetical protein